MGQGGVMTCAAACDAAGAACVGHVTSNAGECVLMSAVAPAGGRGDEGVYMTCVRSASDWAKIPAAGAGAARAGLWREWEWGARP